MRLCVDIALLTHTKGLKGGFVARAAAGLPFLIEEGMELALVPPVLDAPRDVHVTSVTPCGGDEAVVFFGEVASIEEAGPLVGCHCLARRSDLDDVLETGGRARGAGVGTPDLPPWEGWSAYDGETGFIGVIDRIEDRPGQPLLVISDEEGSSVLVPLADDLIVSVDEEGRRIDLACPRGLLDL